VRGSGGAAAQERREARERERYGMSPFRHDMPRAPALRVVTVTLFFSAGCYATYARCYAALLLPRVAAEMSIAEAFIYAGCPHMPCLIRLPLPMRVPPLLLTPRLLPLLSCYFR